MKREYKLFFALFSLILLMSFSFAFVSASSGKCDTIFCWLASLFTGKPLTGQMIGIQAANPADCAEIKASNPSAASGVYTIDPDGDSGNAPFSAYCDMVTGGGGWTLVAHNTNTVGWMNIDSNLTPSYSYGNYQPNPLSNSQFYMNFASFEFSEFLFATGDNTNWLVTPKESFYNPWCERCDDTNCSINITASSCSAQPFIAQWCMRHQYAADPWVTLGNHGGGCGYAYAQNTLYGEGGYNDPNYHQSLKNNHQGANVFIRRVIEAPQQCPPEMISYWNFDDANNPGNDLVNGNSGTMQGTYTWNSGGKVNADIIFNGGYLDAGSSSNLNFVSQDFTIVAWVKGSGGTMVQKGLSNSDGYTLMADPYVHFLTHQPGGFTYCRSNSPVQSGAWQHWAAVKQGSIIKIYLNGVENTPYTGGSCNSIQNPESTVRPFEAGRGSWGYFSGQMDEVAVFGKALSATEVEALYNLTKDGTQGYCAAAPPQPACGNGIKEGSEVCDGNDFGGKTCSSETQGEKPLGNLICIPYCAMISTEGCSAQCTDNDGDGYYAEGGNCGPADCDDDDETVYPGAKESIANNDAVTCWDGIDNNCNNLIDNQDPGCLTGAVEVPSCTIPQILDLNGDNAVNVQDIIHIQRWIAWQLLGSQGAEPELIGNAKACELFSVQRNPGVVMSEQSLC
jgi:hypothetical protein